MNFVFIWLSYWQMAIHSYLHVITHYPLSEFTRGYQHVLSITISGKQSSPFSDSALGNRSLCFIVPHSGSKKIPQLKPKPSTQRPVQLSPSNWLCNFTSRNATPIDGQRWSWKSTAPYNALTSSLVGHWDPSAGIQLRVAGHWNTATVTIPLYGWAYIGSSFERRSDRHWKMSHTVNSVLKLSWWWNCEEW